MNCPICQADSRVERTASSASEVRRHRRCTGCGHLFPTLELREAALEQDREIIAKARELADMIPGR